MGEEKARAKKQKESEKEEMRDRLIELLKSPHKAEQLRQTGVDIGKYEDDCVEAMIADFLLANGVIVSPVKIGQTVWFFSGVLEEVCEAKVVRIDMNFFTNPSLWMEFEYHSQLIGAHVIRGQIDSLFGKTVFLAKEEAEKALRKERARNDREQYKYYAEKVKLIDKQIAPICKVFNITDYGYEVDENGGENLVLNGQKIGCTGNSVSAVVDELIAYIFITRYCRSRSLGAFEKQTINCIMRYWK